MLQLAASLGRAGGRVLYLAAEESVRQVGLRAERLGIAGRGVDILADTSLGAARSALAAGGHLAVVVDSIQALRAEEVPSAPGSVGQVRHCAAELAALAKESGWRSSWWAT